MQIQSSGGQWHERDFLGEIRKKIVSLSISHFHEFTAEIQEIARDERDYKKQNNIAVLYY